MQDQAFESLLEYLSKIPAIEGSMDSGIDINGMWSVKFHIDIHHDLAWNQIQELSSVINQLSLTERLMAIFYPVSPPSYLNGGPEEYLSWVIEATDKDFRPDTLMKWIEGRLPNPVEDPDKWNPDNE